MLIHPGTQERLVSETTAAAGSTSREGSIQSDSLIATVWVNSVTSGNLSISFYTLTDNGKELLLFSFPVLSSGSVDLLLKKAGISMQRFRMVATYTGVCSYEVYVRAVEGAGESSVKIVGADTLETSQITVPTAATLLIPVSLVDRNGLIIKNWNTSGSLYIADSALEATVAEGYPIAAGEALSIDIAGGVEVYGIASAGTIDVRILQAGG